MMITKIKFFLASKAVIPEAVPFETSSETSLVVMSLHKNGHLFLHHYRYLHGVGMRDRDLHWIGFRDMNRVRDGYRHLHRDLNRVWNFLLHRVRDLLLYIHGIRFGYRYWVGLFHVDGNRDLNRDWDFLLHVYRIRVRNGYFNLLGDSDGLHVTLMERFPSSETTAVKGMVLMSIQRGSKILTETVSQVMESSLFRFAVLLLVFSQN
jgi:hypothetical protein